ncbi:hypothetical protein SNOG_14494 [Parastagonospora nodorum SN15]|uniref:Uncharacterized protein n=1 Tax=Phaeosphaeria nodorum (strain SN15 / ATCC MYA-4574 / FGSC 10173) TaxID=321614 RepID=Q0U0X8_PHANO|nr:hypothetical protein SNOG_14494 [Parastagonospora nodorum SN15]EAT78034.1 hypothetical protein SNOG_14494 [Parastagonospora nodorum SN15]
MLRGCTPVPSVDLYYMEESQNDAPYVVQVTTSHNSAVYVSVEKLEHLLADLTCSSSVIDNSTTLTFVFDTIGTMAVAPFTIAYDLENLTAIVTARLSPLGKTPEASSNLRFQGGPMNAELRTKLRRRSALEEYSVMAKRDLKSSPWTFDLNELGDFAPREDIISFKVAAYFDLDFDLSDLGRFDNPFNTARIGLKVLDAIDGNFSIEAAATVNVQVECAYPGTCLKGSTGRGKQFQPRPSRNGNATKISGLTFDPKLSLGIAVGLTAEAGITVKLPATVGVAKYGQLEKDFLGDGLSTGNLTKSATVQIGTPVFATKKLEICGFIALGPAVEFRASLNEVNASISVFARLDLPRVNFCAALAQNVDGKCKLQGPFKEALKLSAGIGAGVKVGAEIDPGSFSVNTEVKGLYFEKTIAQICFDISGDNEKVDKSLPPLGNTSKPKDQPGDEIPFRGQNNDTSTSNAGVLANSTVTYDCSGVAPSPGGQPCGSVIMQCPTLSTWSCGNGQQGIVPPGTFCACGAFRYPGWLAPTSLKPACTTGIVCVSTTTFSVCSPAGIEPPQAVAPGTQCENGGIVAV